MAIKQIDNDTIRQAQGGDVSSFEKIVYLYEKQIFHFILRLVISKEDAEDLTQETFLKLFKNIRKYNYRHKFTSWLFVIARNTVLDFFRRKKRRDFINFGEFAEFFEWKTIERSRRRDLVRERIIDLKIAISKIKPLYQRIIRHFYFEGLDYQEIAEKLNIPVNTVKTNIYRAKKILREQLSHDGV